ncbi:BTB/POZ domain and ankyrin repeat-containing protein NPR1-like [Punica granatum]|uniref:BTB/POZ domain and ankyrin repeat-containing protein NPR1-like n=2 Tax=Punica granatum TaxID=22663 RepID=A0A6P8D9K4_PUNGR|nr:BTB/POZ domain and ankyrin repeat-containing protein NPR1-like [Punica granatum]XP_031393346.1 BTB/POZ domain and ankyrin repeat-containing protein NPR1-like [Punica granatum]OWM73267.1 hypothetical protein CDL15_Pgr001381 [Punica granatum]PKI77288.1 hypothetical protein CRG98_002233 [Punica granatum]
MENEYEISSSSLSFVSFPAGDTNLSGPEIEANPDYLSLSMLSSSLEKLRLDPGLGYADAEIVVDGVPVGVHRCLLAVRSEYFQGLFSKPCNDSQGNGSNDKPRYHMAELMAPTRGYVGIEAFNVVLNYLYTAKMKPSPPEVSTCVNDQCDHDACRPTIDYAVELMYASSTFQIQELVLLLQRRLLYFVDKALIEDVIPILVASFRCNSKQLLSHCIQRVSMSDLDSVVLEKEIPPEVLPEIKSLRNESNQGSGSALPQEDLTDHQKGIQRIHKAIDSDDVELLELLLKESRVTLNDAFALHYATAYSDPKVVKKVLDLKLADLNLKNSRGLTVLHVAARRKVPSILGALLENGACALETTPDGQTALCICRKLTRPKDYEDIQKGKESNKDQVCIDLLERGMKNVSASGRRLVRSEVTAADLHMLGYFESRVKMAAMLFPAEARTAMEMAEADWTPLYKGLALKGSWGTGNSNETACMSAERLQQKLQALRKTVEMGERYFPNCSEEIVKFIDDMPDAMYLEKGTEEEKESKKRRYMELRDDIQRAFYKDIAETNVPASSSLSQASSSSSSSSPRNRIRNRIKLKV